MAQGFFDLKTADDLFRMLERYLERLKKSASEVDEAYAFFVAAAHMPEWIGGSRYKKKLIDPNYCNPLPRICDELANGAKHFVPNSPHHVENTGRAGYFEEGYITPGYLEERLCVYLEPLAFQQLGLNGSSVDVVYIAERVLDFWRNEGGFSSVFSS
jgi:hypothetical protein